jgi:hypothetical protein
MMKKWITGLALLAVLAVSPAWAVEEFVTHTFQSAAGATGNGTALAVDRYSTLGMQVVISNTATVAFEATSDGTNWVAAVCVSIGSTTGTLITSTTSSVVVQCPVAGLQQFRARVSAWTSGTVDVTGRASTAVLGKKGGGGGSSEASSVATSDTLPATCSIGAVYVDNDASTGLKFYYCDTTDTWVALLSSEVQTLQLAFASGKAITGANSEANCFRVGTAANYYCIYSDAGSGLYIKPEPLANTTIRCWTNTDCVLGYDEEGAAAVETLDPDAASTLAMWTYGTAYRPKKSIWFGAGSLSTDGTQCAAPAEVTINSGPKIWTIICTDNDGSTIYGSVKLPDNYDGGTFTFDHVYIQTAANTGALNGDIAAQCRGNGEVPSSTWGTEVAIDDAAVVGSNSNDMTTSAAVTAAGTCAAGDMLYWRYQVDATGTTTTAASLHHVGFRMEYSETSRSQ